MDHLTASLLDLLQKLRERKIPIIVGGGFGLYLKRRHLEATGQRTLFDRLPEPRSTNDLDLFLHGEVLVDFARATQFKETITQLDYAVVEAARYFQWQRPVMVDGNPQLVKIDLLVGPLHDDERAQLKVSKPRVRPRKSIELHAHLVEEAIRIEEEEMSVIVTGLNSAGANCSEPLLVPHAFPYLLMKLHAFDDRRLRGEQEKERQHALDLYTIVGMMTEDEYERTKQLGAEIRSNVHAVRARSIVQNQFAGKTTGGVLRLREHPLFRDDFQLNEFIDVLAEIFPGA